MMVPWNFARKRKPKRKKKTPQASPSDFRFPLYAVANELGEVQLEVFTLGGVTREGKELDLEPRLIAFPSQEEAERHAKMLGPKVWAARAFFPLGKRAIRWTKL